MIDRFPWVKWLVLWLCVVLPPAMGQTIPSPEAVLGFQPGADFRVAR